MQELVAKILEEIKAHRNFASECGNFKVASAFELCVEIIRKHMNDGWIPVEKFGLPHSNEHDFRFWVTIQYTNGFRHTIKAKWDCFDKCFIHQNGKKILQDVIAYKYYSAPEPYSPERSNNHDGEGSNIKN